MQESAVYTKTEIKNNLLGCLEIFLFMGKGIDRFGSTRRDAIRSFILPVVLLPFVLAIMPVLSEAEGPVGLFVTLHAVRSIVTTVLIFSLVYFMSRQYDRQQHFFRFLTVSNWMNVPGLVLCTPIFFAFLPGVGVDPFRSYAIFLTVTGYVYAAFIIARTFRIPWEMGGFIAVLILAIDQNAFSLTLHLQETLG